MKLTSKKGSVLPLVLALLVSLVIVTAITLTITSTYSSLMSKQIDSLRQEVYVSSVENE